jgi:uncharacterized protein DUF4386
MISEPPIGPGRALARATGLLFVVTALGFAGAFSVLSAIFEYPGILRQPTDHILRRFAEGGQGLIVTWYVLTLSAVLLVPAAILLHRSLTGDRTPWMAVATAFGVLAGVVQTLGLIRWVFLVPFLSDLYLNPASSSSTREAVVVVFQGFHRYVGAALGEHLGYMFVGSWVLLAALAMLRTPLFSRWVAYLGFASAAGILVGLLEPAGFGLAVLINALGFILFAIWLLAIAARLLFGRSSEKEPSPAGNAVPEATSPQRGSSVRLRH